MSMTDEQKSSMSDLYPRSLWAMLASPDDMLWTPDTRAELRIPELRIPLGLPLLSADDVRVVIHDALGSRLDGIHRTARREQVCGFLGLPGGDHNKPYSSDVLPQNLKDELQRLQPSEIGELEFMREFAEFTDTWKHDDVMNDFRPDVGKPWKIDDVDPSAEEVREWILTTEESAIEWAKGKLPRRLTSRMVALGRHALASRSLDVTRRIEGELSRITVWPMDDASLSVNELREIIDHVMRRQDAMLTFVYALMHSSGLPEDPECCC